MTQCATGEARSTPSGIRRRYDRSQRLEIGHEVGFFLRTERRGIAQSVDHVEEGGGAPVVEIGRGGEDAAQRRRVEVTGGVHLAGDVVGLGLVDEVAALYAGADVVEEDGPGKVEHGISGAAVGEIR